MPSYRVAISKRAVRDIDLISDQTIERWGKHQAKRYVAAIRSDIESLATSPNRFPRHEGRHLTLRRMRSAHHFVFYRVEGNDVIVIRILHERMNFESRMP
ncbi:MAG: type II toxin-antitoxin system RelE/ParE family toxin [Sphingomonadaceae bacterium]|jgi:toxin ParE1/3/4|nr:type II toxin-antitoxin system RelE/ParE family toxin [Sphingomonadaceae bacterium]